MSGRRILIWIAMLCAAASGLHAQATADRATLRARVQVAGAGRSRHKSIPGTVVWLTPIAGGIRSAAAAPMLGASTDAPANPAQIPRLVQKDKSFEPHILVIPAGSVVEFPNRDPFFHNVFSLFEGKRFDLGLYEAGTTRTVRFDRPGISYIFCNIHPEMSAVVLTMATPLYTVSDANGHIVLAGVPYGRYLLHIWSEGMGPESTPPPAREITIAAGAISLGVIRVLQANQQTMVHKNKYGRDYDDPTPNNSVYEQQR